MKDFHFGHNLRDIRMSKGYKQEVFAAQCGMSQGHYSKQEKRASIPRREMLENLASNLGEPVEALLTPWFKPVEVPQLIPKDKLWVRVKKKLPFIILVLVVSVPLGKLFIDIVYDVVTRLSKEFGASAKAAHVIAFLISFILFWHVIKAVINVIAGGWQGLKNLVKG